MKNRIYLIMTLAILASNVSNAQNKTSEWEIGVGGSVINLTRTMVTNFHQTDGGDYVFNLEDKHLYGGGEIYLAKSISPKWYLDVQGTMGFAKYYDSGSKKQGYSYMVGPGMQFRPFAKSAWIVPYLRVGMNAYHKTFPTRYLGTFDGDVTKEGMWQAEDAWNKGYTADNNTFFPASFGIGVIGWISNRFGVRLQGQYLMPIIKDGPKFVEISAGIQFRLGGGDKRKSTADSYVASHLSDYDELYASRHPERVVEKEIVREVPVEVEKEVVKYVTIENEVESFADVQSLMNNVHFEFDKSQLTQQSCEIIDTVAKILNRYPKTRFMVAGYTDARGSDSYNEDLSRRRAKAVYDALVERNVDKDRLIYRGFGERVAIISESASERDREFDRKVVIERIK